MLCSSPYIIRFVGLTGAYLANPSKKSFYSMKPTIETCFLIDSKDGFLPFVEGIHGKWPIRGHPHGIAH